MIRSEQAVIRASGLLPFAAYGNSQPSLALAAAIRFTTAAARAVTTGVPVPAVPTGKNGPVAVAAVQLTRMTLTVSALSCCYCC